MASYETGKFRAARIPLDYYKKPDLLGWWRRWLLVLAVLLAVGVTAAAALLRSDRGTGLVTRGPVAAVHASWDDKCETCHVSFQPIGGEAWLGHTLAAAHANDKLCKTCHAGPPHHAAEKEGDVADCAACHHEHRGRDADLTRVADSDCTRCHGNLAAHTQKSQPEYAAAVSRFDKDHHPEFKVPAKDPGKLKFNHKLHLTAGLESQFTLDKIDPSRRAWYASQQTKTDANAPVQLNCEACHRLDKQDLPPSDGRPGSPLQQALVPPRNAGNYLLPISYEAECAACHPLTIERKDPDNPRSGHLTAPHHLQPQQLHEYLEGYYTARLLEGKDKLFTHPVDVRRPFPGKLPGEETQPVRQVLDEKITAAERLLYSKNTCFECHFGEEDGGKVAPRKIQATDVPAVWFQHARFDHLAHRAATCATCHEGSDKSTTSADVLLPKRDVCVQCHAAATTSGGGARFDCVECHRYHNGDQPLAGLGAAARGVADKDKLNVQKFLRPSP